MSRKIEKSLSCDQEIEERLRRLKDNDIQVSHQKDIEQRLARLKGIDPSHYSIPPITVYQMKTQNRSHSQQTDDLLKQFTEELLIDDSGLALPSNRRSSTDEDIERRLALLKNETKCGQSKDTRLMDIDSDVDEETEQNNIIERLLAESKLPSIPVDSNSLNSVEDNVEMGEDCLPWCVICNEDAILRCIDCTGDLYCRQCYLDFHDDSDLKKHKTSPFKPNKTNSNVI